MEAPWIVYIKHVKLKADGPYASFIYLNEACGPPALSLTYLVYMKLLPYDKEHSLQYMKDGSEIISVPKE